MDKIITFFRLPKDSERNKSKFNRNKDPSLLTMSFLCDVNDENPPDIKIKANTKRLEVSDFLIATKRDAGLAKMKRKFPSLENNVTKMMVNRQYGIYANESFSPGKKCKISNVYLPNNMSFVDTYRSMAYCGIFSKDGTQFLTGCQDHILRLYNSGNGSYKFMHSLRSKASGWSIIDVAFSPDGKHFVFTTWASSLFLCSTNETNDEHERLKLDMQDQYSSCTFSVVFSSDGKELLGGGNDKCVRIYDLERRTQTVKIKNAHQNDINGAVYADFSSNILYSGSDDGYIKVWDKRMCGSSGHHSEPVGVLVGHTDGITYIDTKGDGRHLISNSKDQSIKLWDTRSFSKPEDAKKPHRNRRSWDYRCENVPKKYFTSERKLACDTSIMTYRGHIVSKTLIRCRFSPLYNTGQRYIFSGCSTGRIVVYDSLTGDIVAAPNGHGDVVRDVAWHPVRNEIISSSWDGCIGKWTYIDQDNAGESDMGDEPQFSRKRTLRFSRMIDQFFNYQAE
ncbi:hypothetical protein JTB14_027462 [Gonioctena quinquepunctata]|nr:hypothetical protein JTB14_027462 [Gonioctena quinquepunctata]